MENLTITQTDLQRYGNPLIKYKLNTIGTHHLICYEYKGLYFSFILLRGRLVDSNDKELQSDLITGIPTKGKHYELYYQSSLNEWHERHHNKPFVIKKPS